MYHTQSPSPETVISINHLLRRIREPLKSDTAHDSTSEIERDFQLILSRPHPIVRYRAVVVRSRAASRDWKELSFAAKV